MAPLYFLSLRTETAIRLGWSVDRCKDKQLFSLSVGFPQKKVLGISMKLLL